MPFVVVDDQLPHVHVANHARGV